MIMSRIKFPIYRKLKIMNKKYIKKIRCGYIRSLAGGSIESKKKTQFIVNKNGVVICVLVP